MAPIVDTRAYLDRIEYKGSLEITLGTLTGLQEAHLKHVPFENLDIHNKIPITFDSAFEKVVLKNRGGFCYELNYLFFQLLKSLHFDAKLVSARVYNKEKGYGPEFDHMAIVVLLDGVEFLVDVGFGEFSFHPIQIDLSIESADPRGVFRIRPYQEDYLLVEKKTTPSEPYSPEYIFTKKKREPSEFKEMLLYHQINPASHFTQKKLCSLPTDEGRITFTGDTLKFTGRPGVTERKIGSQKEAEQILLKYFRIKIV